jgi:Rrf2 family protein
MYISTKTGYALRALIELALSDNGQPLSIAELSNRQQLPPKYLERLFSLLKRAGLVKSRQGSHGGYLLSRSASEITFQEVMLAVEESHFHSYCNHQKIDTNYCQGISCELRNFWDKISIDLESYFSGIYVEDIIKNYIGVNNGKNLSE